MAKFERTKVWALGLRLGFWPCIWAPFVQLHAGPFRLGLWVPFKRG